MTDFAQLRKEYSSAPLEEARCSSDPYAQFDGWLQDAIRAQIDEPNAMVLATVSADHKPSARAVLLKEISPAGLVFYTNYQSRKAQDIASNDFVAATFVWSEIERQIRVEGRAEKISRAESENYFQSRPRGAQLAAAVSQQSDKLLSRAELEQRLQALDTRLAGSDVSCPEFWGGYRINPIRFEFWQGRANRLHDRIAYELHNNGAWARTRLWP